MLRELGETFSSSLNDRIAIEGDIRHVFSQVMGPRRKQKRKINSEEAYEEEYNEEFELTGYEKAVNSRLNTGNRHWSNLLCMPDKSALNVNYKKVMEEGENLVNEYAWAIPNRRALGVIRSVASKSNGLVEVGAGTGYWAAELAAMGVNVNAYDKYVEPDTLWHPVKRGGPEVLRHKANRGRTLLLCYPDEGSSLAIACLDALGSDVDHIIHVGELITTGTFMSSEQRPFGRTSAAEFQGK